MGFFQNRILFALKFTAATGNSSLQAVQTARSVKRAILGIRAFLTSAARPKVLRAVDHGRSRRGKADSAADFSGESPGDNPRPGRTVRRRQFR